MRHSDSEIAHTAQSEKQGATPQGERASGWDRLQRAALTCVGLVGTVGLLALAGCPADLANPQDYQQAASTGGDTSGTGGATGVMKPGLAVDTTCLTAIFAKDCAALAGCHKPGAGAGAGLDLGTAGVNARLIDVPATHMDASPATGCMTGQKLIDSATPEASWLLIKVTVSQVDQKCGFAMPIGAPLTSDELACVTKYTQDVHAAALAGM